MKFFQSNIFEFQMIKTFYNYRKIKLKIDNDKIDNDKIDFNFFMNFFQSNIFKSIVFENTNDVFFVRKTFIFFRSIQNRLSSTRKNFTNQISSKNFNSNFFLYQKQQKTLKYSLFLFDELIVILKTCSINSIFYYKI